MAERSCSNCGRAESSPAAKFCVSCGAPLPDPVAADSAPTENGDLQVAIDELQAQLSRIQSQVNRQTQRIFALESARKDPDAVAPATESDVRSAAPAATPPDSESVAAAEPQAAAPALPDRGASDNVSRNWEWLLGGNWLARIGILALIFGIGFFLKLAFDNEWIGHTSRVLMGIAAGVLLVGGGEYWSRRYQAWAQAVTGGGIAILYLSVFAAYVLYDLVAAVPALGLASIVTVAAAGLAIRYDSRAVAALAMLGGFATPLFLAESLTDQWLLLAYVVVLDLGVLALAIFRNWRWITILAFAGSLALFGFWHAELDPSLALAQAGITVIFLIFVGASNLTHLRRAIEPQPLDWAVIVLNAAAYLAISYGLMFDAYRPWMGAFTLSLALFYGLIGYGIQIRYRDMASLARVSFGIATALLTLAVPVQFDGAWVAAIWAVEGLLLVWLAVVWATPRLRWAAGTIFALIVIKLVILDFADADWRAVYFGAERSYPPIANWHFLAYAAAVAGMYGSAMLVRLQRGRSPDPSEYKFVRALLIAANGLTLFALSAEIFDAFDREYFTVAQENAGQVVSLSLSALWALYAAALIVLGIARRVLWLRVAGLGLLAVPVAKLFIYDAFELAQAYRVAAFMGLGILLIAGGFLYQRYGRVIRGVLLE